MPLSSRARPRGERGVVMIVALLLLAALTLAGVTLMRSVSTGNLVAGNLAFQQSGSRSADRGISAGIQWLDQQAEATLYVSAVGSGYQAFMAEPTIPWGRYYDTTLTSAGLVFQLNGGAADDGGNVVSYVIERLCTAQGSPDAVDCAAPTAQSNCAKRGSSCSGGRQSMLGVSPTGGYSGPSSLRLPVFYRITARSVGPRNARSYVQAIFSK